jgi:putative sterol carrier protein
VSTAARGARGEGRASELFFVHVGSFVAVIVYFALHASAGAPEEAVRIALPVALAVMTAYAVAAHRRHHLKQFDFGLWTMFALGTLAVLAGSERALYWFANYSAAILFTTLGLVATLPLLFGPEPFTVHFARRGTPAWQQKTREFAIINRIITIYFALLFFAGAASAAWAPHDFRFSVLFPNLLVFVAGLPSQLWIPPLYLKLVRPHPPETLEAAIMGMPLTFDAKAARGAEATIQFQVSGPDAGSYTLRVDDRGCQSFEGAAPAPDLTISTPDSVWLQIARGELDAAQALVEQQYRVEGETGILLRLAEWFPRGR